MLDATIARLGEEIKEEDLTVFYEAIFEMKDVNDKTVVVDNTIPVDKTVPITFARAKEIVLRYAVSIKMIPSRLKTALEAFKTDYTMPER